MTTLVPSPAYTQEELDRLYPKQLKLQLVQIVSVFASFNLLYSYASPLQKKK